MTRAATSAGGLGIRRHAAPLLASLLDACEERRPPCRGTDSRLWTSEEADDRRQAAEACGHCPHRHPCHAYAVAQRERAGVWAGTDRSALPTTTRRTA